MRAKSIVAMAVKRPKKAKKRASPVIHSSKNLSVEAQFAQKLAHAEPTMRDRVRERMSSEPQFHRVGNYRVTLVVAYL